MILQLGPKLTVLSGFSSSFKDNLQLTVHHSNISYFNIWKKNPPPFPSNTSGTECLMTKQYTRVSVLARHTFPTSLLIYFATLWSIYNILTCIEAEDDNSSTGCFYPIALSQTGTLKKPPPRRTYFSCCILYYTRISGRHISVYRVVLWLFLIQYLFTIV